MIAGDDKRKGMLIRGTGVPPVSDGPESVSTEDSTGETPVPQVERALHKLVKKVGEDIEAMKFNTAIAAMMEFVNAVYKAGRITTDQAGRFVLVLAPFAQLGERVILICGSSAKYSEILGKIC